MQFVFIRIFILTGKQKTNHFVEKTKWFYFSNRLMIVTGHLIFHTNVDSKQLGT